MDKQWGQPAAIGGKWMVAAALVLVLSIIGLLYDNRDADALPQGATENQASAAGREVAEQSVKPLSDPASRSAVAVDGDVAAWYAEGKKYVNKDNWKQALPYFEKAAAKGHHGAKINLAVAYLEGRGVKRDIVYGCRLMEQAAAESNLAIAWSNLGLCIEDLPHPDYAKAAAAYQKAASAGMADAQLALGNLYVTGRGVPQEASVGMYWYGMAAGNHPAALRLLGACLLARECSKQYYDPAIGYALLKIQGRRADKGSWMAQLKQWYRDFSISNQVNERDRQHGEEYLQEWSALDDRAIAERALLESGAVKAQP